MNVCRLKTKADSKLYAYDHDKVNITLYKSKKQNSFQGIYSSTLDDEDEVIIILQSSLVLK